MPKEIKKDDRYFMSSVKVGAKGQIVIPKGAREMFGIKSGDNLVLIADSTRGIAIQSVDMLHPYLKQIFNGMEKAEE